MMTNAEAVTAVVVLALTSEVTTSALHRAAARIHLLIDMADDPLWHKTPGGIVAQKKIDKPRCASRLLTIFFSPTRSVSKMWSRTSKCTAIQSAGSTR